MVTLPVFSAKVRIEKFQYHKNLFVASKFGAVLDMVTDRSTTAGLICYLATIYPQFMLFFQILLGLDLSSHYMHMYASLSSGAASHKAIDSRQNWLMRAYYGYQSVLFLVCAGNELFFLGLYLMHSYPNEQVWLKLANISLRTFDLFTLVVAPVFMFKQFMNVVQLFGASKSLAGLEKKKGK